MDLYFSSLLQVVGLEKTFEDDFRAILHGFASGNPESTLKRNPNMHFYTQFGPGPKYLPKCCLELAVCSGPMPINGLDLDMASYVVHGTKFEASTSLASVPLLKLELEKG